MEKDQLQVLLGREQIADRVKQLAASISRDYRDKNLLAVAVLKGAVIFLSDLIRNLTVDIELDFIAASSYHRHDSTGRVGLSPILSTSVRNKDVLVVEDIIDTGLTYQALTNFLSVREPASIRLCTLLNKPSQRRTDFIMPDYVGFKIPDQFVVGYGLDYEERYRELQDICVLEM
jgi:hypoxanthine phosphoribosyltransferase